MTECERLIEILRQGYEKKINLLEFEKEILADYLLENGVSVRPWITDRLPDKDGRYEVTVKGSKGNRFVSMCNFTCNANKNKWEKGVTVLAWRERDKPYRETK